MRTIAALVLEPEDFASNEKARQAHLAMAAAELVTYRGDIVKHVYGKITRQLSAIQAQERRKEQRVY
jgi:hypothetical protein